MAQRADPEAEETLRLIEEYDLALLYEAGTVTYRARGAESTIDLSLATPRLELLWIAASRARDQVREARDVTIDESAEQAITGHNNLTGYGQSAIALYTDGSGISGRVGAAAVCPQYQETRTAYMGEQLEATVNAAELQGIFLALIIILRHRSYQAVVFTDNQVTLQALQNPGRQFEQYLVEAIIVALNIAREGSHGMAADSRTSWQDERSNDRSNSASSDPVETSSFGGKIQDPGDNKYPVGKGVADEPARADNIRADTDPNQTGFENIPKFSSLPEHGDRADAHGKNWAPTLSILTRDTGDAGRRLPLREGYPDRTARPPHLPTLQELTRTIPGETGRRIRRRRKRENDTEHA
ncbi:ribonuclease H family protein [Aspergillus affinis]|uniref:ribonuclease H family protein n=1 Tax=Aspergillus affinis TaxID=1070780 RepID=UPI0022FEA6B5|nr:uncharacterized protein KD926_010303 [Aspergillus affinis]KAI9044980.1 hypothetical protein KD926_010303 [Aspergillus affinis]